MRTVYSPAPGARSVKESLPSCVSTAGGWASALAPRTANRRQCAERQISRSVAPAPPRTTRAVADPEPTQLGEQRRVVGGVHGGVVHGGGKIGYRRGRLPVGERRRERDQQVGAPAARETGPAGSPGEDAGGERAGDERS